MKDKSYRANSTDVNKTPPYVRYVFILKLKTDVKDRGDIVGATTTFKTLNENIKLDVESVKVVDLKNNTIQSMILESMTNFLDEWKENYFDYDWDIPFQFCR